MTRIEELEQEVVRLMARVSDAERRQDNTVRRGEVKEVDDEKRRYRMEIANKDGKPVLSPWMPYPQFASGSINVDIPPVIGQQMMLISPNGDPQQANGYPYTYSDQNPGAGAKSGEGIIKHGNHSLKVSSDGFAIKGKLTLDGDFEHSGGKMTSDGKRIDGSHRHSDVEPGGGQSGVPIA